MSGSVRNPRPETWDADIGLANVAIDGASDEITDEMSRLDGHWFPELPYYPCAD